MSQLCDLPFVDLYLCLQDTKRAHYKPRRGVFSPDEDYSIPEEYQADLQRLVAALRLAMEKTDEPSIMFEGMRLRASVITTAAGEEWVAMRRNPGKPPALNRVGMDPRLIQQLRNLGRRDGLILIVGATAQGKTTSAYALLQDYLERYGNVAYTIEDPVEYTMDDTYGKNGHCYQVEVRNDHEWALRLKKALRWQPQYILVGEVRTPDAAAQLLRAATSGHLVITTLHGGSIEEGLEGLLQLAEQSAGLRAAQLLAAGLTAVWHQELDGDRLKVRFYITEEGNLADPVRNNIRAGQIGHIATYVDKQMARLANMSLPEGREPTRIKKAKE